MQGCVYSIFFSPYKCCKYLYLLLTFGRRGANYLLNLLDARIYIEHDDISKKPIAKQIKRAFAESSNQSFCPKNSAYTEAGRSHAAARVPTCMALRQGASSIGAKAEAVVANCDDKAVHRRIDNLMHGITICVYSTMV
jgi:hypothetical protein